MAGAASDIFRMVSLRGPSRFSTLTPASSETTSSYESRMASPTIDPDKPDETVVAVLKRRAPLTPKQLAASRVAVVANELKDLVSLANSRPVPFDTWLKRLSEKRVPKGSQSVTVRNAIMDRVFASSMKQLWDTWFYLRVGVQANASRTVKKKLPMKKAAALDQVEHLLRVGTLASALVNNPDAIRDRGAFPAIMNAPLSYPKAWSITAKKALAKLVAPKSVAKAAPIAPASPGALAALTGRGKRSALRARAKQAADQWRDLESIILKANWLHDKLVGERATVAKLPVSTTAHTRALVADVVDKLGATAGAPVGLAALRTAGSALFGNLPQAIALKGTAQTTTVVPVTVDAAFVSALAPYLNASETVTIKMIAPNLARQYGRDVSVFRGLLAELEDYFHRASQDFCKSIQVYEGEAELPEVTAPQSAVTVQNRPSIRAIGFGDLILARERLVAYDAREIAHIENILPGEQRLREHERTTRREDVTETEETEESRTERDLQTTDRYELQSQTQKTINEQFSVEAGLNISGKYGVTSVEASLDAGFSRSSAESRSATSNTAKEMISRAVESTYERVREMRRVTTMEQIKEINRHGFSGSSNSSYSGVYYFVEKVHEVELRYYGTRLMMEFFIPEPGLSLLPGNNLTGIDAKKPAPFAISPDDIDEYNYKCLVDLYGAVAVQAPPALEVTVGWAWSSQVDESGNENREEAANTTIQVPDGYAAARVTVTWSALSFGDATFGSLAVAGCSILQQDSLYPGLTIWRSIGNQIAPNGLPATLWVRGHYDKTAHANVQVKCERTRAALDAWKLATYERLREAHAMLVSTYERKLAETQIRSGVAITARPAAENRRVEIEELKKWAVKTMRLQVFNYDAVVSVQGEEEIDPVKSDAFAAVARFFEQAFEWREMSYFLYPYFWGRRSNWEYRRSLRDPDPRHELFLKAGAARVVVPVTPSFEARILHYLHPADPTMTEDQRIAWSVPSNLGSVADELATSEAKDAWIDVLTESKKETSLGSGTLSVTRGAVRATIDPESLWTPDERDIGRELYIAGVRYEVADFHVPRDAVTGDPISRSIDLDRPYEAADAPAARYATGSVRLGSPWEVRIPTPLVILAEERAKLAISV